MGPVDRIEQGKSRPKRLVAHIEGVALHILGRGLVGPGCGDRGGGDIDGFERLREKYGVKIIYDAAHAFGVRALANAGDMSMYSFHPTKLFHSCEGGLLVFKDRTLQNKLLEIKQMLPY